MKSTRTLLVATVSAFIVVFPAIAAGQDLTEGPAVPDAVVNFGPVHPQPAPPGNHVLVPNDVTIFKGGTVTFIVNGGGHGIAIYPVSKNTTRADIEEDLCPGGPGGPCTGATANRDYQITDGDDNVIIITGTNPPENRVNYAPDQVMSAGAGAFLVGSTAAGAAGTQVRVRFPEDGRYLVICMNRGHSLNDYMFGFVNVQ